MGLTAVLVLTTSLPFLNYLCFFTLTFSTSVCMVSSRAASCFHGATEPGREKRMCSPSTASSVTYVILMRTLAPGGKLPTLTVNTSCQRKDRMHIYYKEMDRIIATITGTSDMGPSEKRTRDSSYPYFRPLRIGHYLVITH